MRLMAHLGRVFAAGRRKGGRRFDTRVDEASCDASRLFRLGIEADELFSGSDSGLRSGGASGPKVIGYEIGAYAPPVPMFLKDERVAMIPEGV
jgi:hypothetical protein